MTLQDAINQTKYNQNLAKSTAAIKPSTITSPATPTLKAIKSTASTASSMNKQVPNDYASVRDYINNYGQKYGLNNNDIGWVENKNNVGGNVMLKGSYLATPDIDVNGTSYMNQNALKQAIDDYANKNGLKDMSAQQQAPDTYKSQYTDQIQALLNKLNNQQQFTYNPDTDPTFQSYKQQYAREGDRALNNALGDLSAMTGGQLNSYAASAATQAQNNYSQALMDKLPQLAQMAYSQYQNGITNDRNNLSALENLDNQDYSKYRNTVSDYINNRNYQNSVQQAIANAKYNQDKLASDSNYNTSKLNSDNKYRYDVLNSNIDDKNIKNQISGDKNTITSDYNNGKLTNDANKIISTDNYNQGKLANEKTKITNDNNNTIIKNKIDQQKMKNEYVLEKEKNRTEWTKVNNDVKFQIQKVAIEKAYDNGKLSIDQYNAQVNKAYKDAQTRIQQQKTSKPAKTSTTSYKTNVDFGKDLAYVNKNKTVAYKQLISSPDAFIKKYGYDGYKELLKTAQGNSTNKSGKTTTKGKTETISPNGTITITK